MLKALYWFDKLHSHFLSFTFTIYIFLFDKHYLIFIEMRSKSQVLLNGPGSNVFGVKKSCISLLEIRQIISILYNEVHQKWNQFWFVFSQLLIYLNNSYYPDSIVYIFSLTCWPFQFFALDELFVFEFFEAVDVAICCWVWCIICWIISNCCLVKQSSLSAVFCVSDWPFCWHKYRDVINTYNINT